MDERKYWLGFSLVPDIGPVRLQQLWDAFGSLERAWHATEADLEQAGLPSTALAKFLRRRTRLNLDNEMKRVEQAGAYFLTWQDNDYPPLLRKVADAPPVLYVRGELLPQDELALAIVGTRRATRYGFDATRWLSEQLARQRVTIISGLANGVDTAAHEGALAAPDGRTIAILGCGIDRIYPANNRELAHRIVERGCLVSEFALGTPPSGINFPRRNRIISGMALGVLVGEAPERSGALITAEVALEQGRDVFAIPANIFNQMGRGGNRLLQDGAKLVLNAADIFDELNIVHERQQTQRQTEQVAPESDNEQKILSLLEADPIHIDDLIRLSGLSAPDVTATLTLLELKGLAQKGGPMEYCRTQ